LSLDNLFFWLSSSGLFSLQSHPIHPSQPFLILNVYNNNKHLLLDDRWGLVISSRKAVLSSSPTPLVWSRPRHPVLPVIFFFFSFKKKTPFATTHPWLGSFVGQSSLDHPSSIAINTPLPPLVQGHTYIDTSHGTLHRRTHSLTGRPDQTQNTGGTRAFSFSSQTSSQPASLLVCYCFPLD